MKALKNSVLLLASVLLFASCEDVIELDLNSTEPRIIIEATIDASSAEARVVLTESNDFYDNGAPQAIESASIEITDEGGNVVGLNEVTAGVYTAAVSVSSGQRYTITVETGAETYTATALTPQPATLDSITINSGGAPPFGVDGDISVVANWIDVPGHENHYRIRTYENGSLLAGNYSLVDDELRGDGNEIMLPIQEFFEEDREITLELLSVDAAYYDYFYQLFGQSPNNPNSGTPFNPQGNFDNDALGYFGIFYSSSLTVEL